MTFLLIQEQADTEWKFARTKLWMSYFEDGATVPPPFNVIPTPKSVFYLFKWLIRKFCSQTRFAKNEALKTIRVSLNLFLSSIKLIFTFKYDFFKQRKARQASERDHRYQNVIRLLVRRYITNEQRIAERKRGVTEDDCNEIKQDISALRFELIELMGRRSNNSVNGSRPPTNAGVLNTQSNDSNISNSNLPSNNFNSNLTSNLVANDCSNSLGNSQQFSNNSYAGSISQLNQNDSMNRCGCVVEGLDCGANRGTLCGCPSSLSHHNTMPATQLCTGKRDRQKERRLMKGFDFNSLYLDSATSVDEDCALLLQGLSASERQQFLSSNALLVGSNGALTTNAKNKSPNRNRFIRLARGIASKRNRPMSNLLTSGANNSASTVSASNVASNSALISSNLGNNKWKQLIEATRSKVKPFSRSSESVNSDLNLQNPSTSNGKHRVSFFIINSIPTN